MSRKSNAAAKPPTKRQLRVGEEIRHVLAGIFIRQDTYIEELRGISITVSEVSVSPDLSKCQGVCNAFRWSRHRNYSSCIK